MKYLYILSLVCIFSCDSKQDVYGERAKSYLFDNFAITLREGDSIIVLNTWGCRGCIQNESNFALSRYDLPIIVSMKFMEKFDIQLTDNMYVDGKNLCEKLNLPLWGVTLITITKNGDVLFHNIENGR